MSKGRIAFLTLDWTKGIQPVEPNGCAYYRCYLPGIELAKKDWNIAVAMPEYNKDYGFGAFENKERIHYGWDIVVFN